jgi:thioredoxin-related protein
MGHPTILLFLSASCGRCEDLIDLWNREIQPILSPDAQVVICLRDTIVPTLLARLIGNRKVIIPEKRVLQIVGVKLTPTVIGLDEYGLVVFIQPGYSEVFGRDFYEHFAMTAR